MRTLQGIKMNVNYMMEQMRIDAINNTFEKLKEQNKKINAIHKNREEIF